MKKRPNTPFPPARLPFFYGWVILAAGTIGGMMITTIGLIGLGTGELSYWMIIGGNGIVWGLYTVLIGVTWPRFYGLKNLGAISGYSLSWTVIGSAFGPYLFSLSKKITGSYDLVSGLCLIIALALLILAFKADNPNNKQSGAL